MKRPPTNGIEMFLSIVREGSLRAAARALGVGAPAVSHRLKALERNIGVDLFVRTTRSIELTDARRTLLAGLPPFYLYYPQQNRRLELLRLFIDFLASKREIYAAAFS